MVFRFLQFITGSLEELSFIINISLEIFSPSIDKSPILILIFLMISNHCKQVSTLCVSLKDYFEFLFKSEEIFSKNLFINFASSSEINLSLLIASFISSLTLFFTDSIWLLEKLFSTFS